MQHWEVKLCKQWKYLWSQKWPVWKKYGAVPYFSFRSRLDQSCGASLITLHCFTFSFRKSLKVIYIQDMSGYFIQIKYASVAVVLKFYMTEVVVRQSEAEEAMPQNRQVLSNCMWHTPKCRKCVKIRSHLFRSWTAQYQTSLIKLTS